MTKKDFYIIIIKLFGLYSLIATLFSGIINSLYYAFADLDFMSYIWIAIVFIVVFGLFILLIFGAKTVVSLLKLDKGFDDDRIEFGNLDSKSILQFAIIILGGTLLIDTIPSLLSYLMLAFKAGVAKQSMQDIVYMDGFKRDDFLLIMYIIEIVIGYLMITNFRFLAKIILGKSNVEIEEATNELD